MSDFIKLTKLTHSNKQLPIKTYFKDIFLKREIHQLFSVFPRYIGHELMIPNIGDYITLPWEDESHILIHNGKGIELLSNICRHRQAKILNGRNNIDHIVCPVHQWTYNLKGKLIGAPYFNITPCLNLVTTPLQNWNGLLFEKNNLNNITQQLKQLNLPQKINFSNYLFDHIDIHKCNYNWKTFIEVYLEDYHVESYHPGLSAFVNCNDLHWEFGQNYSIQIVGINHCLTKAGSPAYKKWQEKLLRFNNNSMPEFGAIWLILYPNIMIECYPYVLIISTIWPKEPQKTINIIEFYYPEEIALFERDMIEAERAAYMETYIEDAEIAQRIDSGRYILMTRGMNEIGPYQSPMEDGMKHFHRWYHHIMFNNNDSLHEEHMM